MFSGILTKEQIKILTKADITTIICLEKLTLLLNKTFSKNIGCTTRANIVGVLNDNSILWVFKKTEQNKTYSIKQIFEIITWNKHCTNTGVFYFLS